MVKIIFLMLSFSFLVIMVPDKNKLQKSKNKCGMTRTRYNLKSVGYSFYKICDTASVYQYDGEFLRDGNNKLYYARYGYKNYYKFYGNGRAGYFGLKDGEELSLKNINPCRFLDAYYGTSKKGNYILKRKVETNANGNFTIKKNLKFRNDTLEFTDDTVADTACRVIFIKKKIPAEWLVYNPDW